MTTCFDSQFSVYKIFTQDKPLNIFSQPRSMVEYWCTTIESNIIDQKLDADVFLGLQHLQHFIPLIPTYKEISKVASNIWVFGLPYSGLPQLTHIHYIPISAEEQLSNELFCVAYNDRFSRAVATIEIPRHHHFNPSVHFQGVVTLSRPVVANAHQQLRQFISSM